MKFKKGDKLLWTSRYFPEEKQTCEFVRYSKSTTDKIPRVVANNWEGNFNKADEDRCMEYNFRLLTPLDKLV